jgi:photosystem II stability/assembly factor-like uncharacterized protein
MIALVQTIDGAFSVDLETDEVEPWEGEVEAGPAPQLNLPCVFAAAAAGSAVFAVVDTRPPLVVSHDAGTTWRESGRGLPPGVAIAIADDDPDVAVFAARNRLYLTRNGGVFWTALTVELPEITRLLVISPL